VRSRPEIESQTVAIFDEAEAISLRGSTRITITPRRSDLYRQRLELGRAEGRDIGNNG